MPIRGSLRPRSTTTKTGRKRPILSQQSAKKKSARGSALSKNNVAKAKKKFYTTAPNKKKWDKIANDWLKSHNGKSKKMKTKAGGTFMANSYFQFLAFIETKAGKTKKAKVGSRFLGQFLWKKFSKKYKLDSKTTAKSRPVKVPQSKRHKALTKTEINKKAKTYKRSKVTGKFGKLRKKVGLKNAQKVVAASKKLK
jgi:hypothetical protein